MVGIEIPFRQFRPCDDALGFLTGDSRLGLPPSGNKSRRPPGLLVAAGVGTMFRARFYDVPLPFLSLISRFVALFAMLSHTTKTIGEARFK